MSVYYAACCTVQMGRRHNSPHSYVSVYRNKLVIGSLKRYPAERSLIVCLIMCQPVAEN